MATDDRWLDEVLRRPEPYLDDAGFSARVVSALPRQRSDRARRLVLGASVLAAALASVALPPLRASLAAAGRLLGDSAAALALLSPEQAQALGPGALAAAMALVALSVWAGLALARQDGR